MKTSSKHRLERRLAAAGAVILALYNAGLAMFRAPLAGIGQIQHVVPGDLIAGSRFALVLIALVLLVIAPGLWHGKRAAWLVACVCAALSVAAHPLKNVDLWGAGASMFYLGMVFGARAQFPARSDRPRAVRGLITLLAGAALIFLYGVAGLYFQDNEFRHPLSLWLASQDAVRLLFILPATEAEPITRHAAWFIDSVRVAALFVVAVAVFQLLQPVIYRTTAARHERERARSILQRYGNSSLAHFALLPDKNYFFSKAGDAFLAYGVTGGTAVVMGDPIGEETQFPELIESFQEHCELNGWTYGFNQARPEYLQLYEERGLKALKTGEEGIVDIQDFSLSGHAMKHLRATMNRFEREGFTTEIVKPPHSDSLLTELKRVSDAWLLQGRRRERRFMLGYFDPALLQECEIMLARDRSGKTVAFANIIPSYRSPEGNFDMLRYGVEPKDAADFLYVSLIEYFRERGFKGMNLGLAPFSGLEESKGGGPADLAMRLLYRHGSFLLRYQGLREYKEKFARRWEPRYLIYPGEAQLLGVALATMRIGEFKARKRRRRGRREGDAAMAPAAAADA